MLYSGTDPELLLGGGANREEPEAQYFNIIFLKNPMKLNKIWSIGRMHREAPPRSATAIDSRNQQGPT